MNENEPHPCVHTWERSLRTAADWENAVLYYKRLSELALAPEIVSVTADQLVAHWYPPLPCWGTNRSLEELIDMGLSVLRRVEELHGHGVCHRDLHTGNIVVRAGVPLFIDTEFATASDPAKPCYDLVGPERSCVAVPKRHADQPSATELQALVGSVVVESHCSD
jgi:thiamine kinase-like enzyme